MNVLIDKRNGCGGGFIWKCPECGWSESSRNYDTLYDHAVEHRRSNNHPVGNDWEKIFQDQMCAQFSVLYPKKECCQDENFKPALYPTPAFYKQLGSAFLDFSKWVLNGIPKTQVDVAEKRYEICKDCEFWNGMEFWGQGRCRKCGCCSRLKISMATTKCPIGKW